MPVDSRRQFILADAAREYVWLYDHRHGLSVAEIASHEGVSARRVRLGLARAREIDEAVASRPIRRPGSTPLPPHLVPLFPVLAYVPASSCPHCGEIRPGSCLCCMVCHRSGMDDHPALRRDPHTDPKPDPKPPAVTVAKTAAKTETRRQRRARLFGHASALSPASGHSGH